MEIYNPSGKQMQKRELFRNASKDFKPTKTYAFSLRTAEYLSILRVSVCVREEEREYK